MAITAEAPLSILLSLGLEQFSAMKSLYSNAVMTIIAGCLLYIAFTLDRLVNQENKANIFASLSNAESNTAFVRFTQQRQPMKVVISGWEVPKPLVITGTVGVVPGQMYNGQLAPIPTYLVAPIPGR